MSINETWPDLVDQTWQNKNRVFPGQGPDVAVQAVRRRMVSIG